MSINEDPLSWRRRTAGGIPYKLLEDGPKGQFAEETASVEEVYLLQASRLLDFVNESFTDLTVFPGTTWNHRPARSCPGYPQMVTKTLSFEPFPPGKPGDPFMADNVYGAVEAIGMPRFDPLDPEYAATYSQFVKVTINYEAGKSDEQDFDLLELSANATGEYLLVPSQGCKTEDEDGGDPNPLQVPMPIPKMVPGLEWSAKFSRIPRSSVSAALNFCRPLLGKVNDGPMPILYATEPETIMFSAFDFSLKWTWRDKEPYATFGLKFLEKRVDEDGNIYGHNHFYVPKVRAGQSNWQKVLRPDGRYVYDTADLNAMFYGTG